MEDPIPKKIKLLLEKEGIQGGVSGYTTYSPFLDTTYYTVHDKNGNVVCVCQNLNNWEIK